MQLKSHKQQHYPATLSDAANLLRLHKNTLRYYVLRRVVTPAVDSSGKPLFLPDDIAAIQRHREKFGKKKTVRKPKLKLK